MRATTSGIQTVGGHGTRALVLCKLTQHVVPGSFRPFLIVLDTLALVCYDKLKCITQDKGTKAKVGAGFALFSATGLGLLPFCGCVVTLRFTVQKQVLTLH